MTVQNFCPTLLQPRQQEPPMGCCNNSRGYGFCDNSVTNFFIGGFEQQRPSRGYQIGAGIGGFISTIGMFLAMRGILGSGAKAQAYSQLTNLKYTTPTVGDTFTLSGGTYNLNNTGVIHTGASSTPKKTTAKDDDDDDDATVKKSKDKDKDKVKEKEKTEEPDKTKETKEKPAAKSVDDGGNVKKTKFTAADLLAYLKKDGAKAIATGQGGLEDIHGKVTLGVDGKYNKDTDVSKTGGWPTVFTVADENVHSSRYVFQFVKVEGGKPVYRVLDTDKTNNEEEARKLDGQNELGESKVGTGVTFGASNYFTIDSIDSDGIHMHTDSKDATSHINKK